MFESDQHASEVLYDWFKENKLYVLAFIVILFGGSFITKLWIAHKEDKSQQAALYFSKLLKNVEANNAEKTNNEIALLMNDYSSTPYADLSAIISSKISLVAANTDKAIVDLKHIIDNSKQPAVRDIARFRLARIYLSKQQVELATQELKKISKFGKKTAMNYLISGDVFIIKHRYSKAINSYQQALLAVPAQDEEFDALKAYIVAKLNEVKRNQNNRKSV